MVGSNKGLPDLLVIVCFVKIISNDDGRSDEIISVWRHKLYLIPERRTVRAPHFISEVKKEN